MTVASATSTPTGGPCAGDCDGSGSVAVNELILGVRIALGEEPLSVCPVFDRDEDNSVSVNELIAGVNNALSGCPQDSAETFRACQIQPLLLQSIRESCYDCVGTDRGSGVGFPIRILADTVSRDG